MWHIKDISDNLPELNESIYFRLAEGDFFYAAECMAAYIEKHVDRNDTLYKIRQLETEMEMSCQWWKKGLPKPADDNMVEIYFIPKLFTVWQDYFLLDFMTANNGYLIALRNKVRASGRDWSWAEVRKRLESFVANIAVMQLQADSEGMEQRLKVVFEEQKKYRQQMFLYVLTELTFRESDIEELEQLLLTPTVDNIDQRLILSALTINGLMAFDPMKTKLMMNVYHKAMDTSVRQYALVGWTLNMPVRYYPCTANLRKLVKELVNSDKTVREDIAQLQIQLGYCMSAAEDSQDFQSAVMPEIIKASNIRMTGKGMEIMEEDPMDDILGRSDAEKKMEEMEDKMRAFIDKRRQGMDLFYQGFKHMKRYPFFNEIANWLIPFYHEHPDITEAIEKTGGENGLLNMMLDAPICDSDKYSFVFAFISIMDRMPREIVEQCKMTPGAETQYMDWMSDPAILRRNYLQSLYRFFELFPYASSFRNPFNESFYYGILGENYIGSPAIIAGNELLCGTLFEEDMLDLVKHFIRRKNLPIAKSIFGTYDRNDMDRYELCYIRALLTIDDNLADTMENLKRCIELEPDNLHAKKLYAKELYGLNEFNEARDLYGQLSEAQPNNWKWLFCYALCCDKMGEHEEGLNVLFRLNYECPDDDKVKIMLAKSLLMLGRAGEAITHVEKMKVDKVDKDIRTDLVLIHSLCLLSVDRRSEAVTCFSRFMGNNDKQDKLSYNMVSNTLREHIDNYKKVLLGRYGIDLAMINLFIHETAMTITARA